MVLFIQDGVICQSLGKLVVGTERRGDLSMPVEDTN